MATETTAIREKTRKVKNHILDRYLKLADRVDLKGEGDLSDSEAAKYWELTKEFARNAVPRSQEITGDDGEAIQVNLVNYDPNIPTVPVPAESVSTTPAPSV